MATLICLKRSQLPQSSVGPRALAAAELPRDGALETTNSAGRSGAFYLPTDFPSRPLPVLVALHGTGGRGRDMVERLRPIAEERRIILVAPDSRIAPNGQPSWEVPTQGDETTEDTAHIRRCVEEVLAKPGVRADPAHVLIAGHSGGASTAPYEASTDARYDAFAVLHGGVFANGLGQRRPRAWFSTGSSDPLRPPSGVHDAVEQTRRAGFHDVTYREYPGGHDVGDAEVRDLVDWWLGPQR